MGKRLLAAGLLASLFPVAAGAQEPGPTAVKPLRLTPADLGRALEPLSKIRFDATPAGPDDEGRRCAGCPVRRLVRPYLESLAVNVMYNGINHARGHETAKITFRTMWLNLRHGFEWDVNPWGVNQIGHPYQGSNYFTSGRAHGLTFWEATPVAAFGSSTWEFLFENNRASLNDLINTTLGGVALGEVMHRIGWLIRDPTLTGKSRSRKEFIAMAVDPFGGLQRLTSGDSKRVAPKPSDMIPSSVRTRGGAGVVWQGRNVREARSSAQPFLDIDMDYGDVRNGRSKVPFEAFEFQFTAGGGSAVSLANVRGRYFGRPFGVGGQAQFSILQTFDYTTNKAYAFGGQGVEVEVAMRRQLSSGASLWMAATGGSTILGAVDTLLNPPEGVTLDPEVLKRRTYDYGPTIRWGGVLELQRSGEAFARLSYQGYQLNVVDGTRAFHVLQRMHLDIRAPLVRRIALGMAGEYFFRKAYFWSEGNRSRTDQSPQFRIFAAWRQK
jgi:hypothetical protein